MLPPPAHWLTYTPLALTALARYYLYVWAIPPHQWRHVAHRGLLDYQRRTACLHCGQALAGWNDAAFGPAGRCRRCGRTLAAPAWTVELAAVAIAALAAWSLAGRGPAATVVFTAWIGIAAAEATADWTVRRLPLRASRLAAVVVVVGFAAAALAEGDATPWLRAMLAGMAAAILIAVGNAAGPRSRQRRQAEAAERRLGGAPHPLRAIGGGDAPFIFSVCAVGGWISATAPATLLLVGLLATAMTGIVAAVVTGNWRLRVPYGPGVVAAAALVWVLAT